APRARSRPRSEFRAAAERKELRAVIRLLEERICEIEAQRAERRVPDQARSGRGAHGRAVGELHATLAEEWSHRRLHDPIDFAGRGGLRLAPIAPDRSGIDEDSAAEAAVFRQEVERILEFEAGAPKHRAADIVVGGPRRDVART